MKKYAAILLFGMMLAGQNADATIRFQPGTDITGALNQAIEAGEGGIGPCRAVIHISAGTFKLSASIDLHGSTLSGEGPDQTVLLFPADLGKTATGFTGDFRGKYGHFNLENLKIEGPRPGAGVHSGECPNQMNGVHLYNNCTLSNVALQYFNSAIVIDGNHHTITNTYAQANYVGVEYVLSSDKSYFDDFYEGCSFTANGLAGIKLDDNVPMGGATFLRVHTGFEPYAILLGHASTINGCQFLQTQFEGVGNADIADTDGTSVIAANYFASCSGWGGRYNNKIENEPISPSLHCGTFLSNVIFCGAMMGPTPGDLTASQGLYGNTWVCDSITGRELKSGKLAPLKSLRSNTHDNTLLIGGVLYKSVVATLPVGADQIVQSDGERNPGCVPQMHGASIGRTLAATPVDSIAWVSTSASSISSLQLMHLKKLHIPD